jgi:hypothetical protein
MQALDDGVGAINGREEKPLQACRRHASVAGQIFGFKVQRSAGTLGGGVKGVGSIIIMSHSALTCL